MTNLVAKYFFFLAKITYITLNWHQIININRETRVISTILLMYNWLNNKVKQTSIGQIKKSPEA